MLLESLDTLIAFAVVMLLLSLLITAIVQFLAGLLDLRGKNLLWGIQRLLPRLDADLQGEARFLAESILRHPALTPFKKKLATAIRAEELVLVLEDLSSDGSLDPKTRDAFKRLFQNVIGRDSPEMTAKIQELLQRFDTTFPDQARTLRQTVETTLGTTQEVVVKVNAWFDTVMDRTSERFKVHTRYVTVAAAAAVALILGVDSLAILNQLRTNSELRNSLVEMSEGTLRQAETVFAVTQEEVAGEAIRGLAAQGSSAALFAQLCAREVPAAESASRCAAGLTTRQEGIKWILAKGLPADEQDQAVAAFTAAFEEKAKARLKDLSASIAEIDSRLKATDLELFALSWPNQWGWPGLLGRLITLLFLSLGAPFWYNLLRKMADLRPIVARKVEGEAPKAQR